MPTTFVIGQILMLFGRRELEAQASAVEAAAVGRRVRVWTFPFVSSLVYALAIFLPVTGWYFYAHMGWSTVYLRLEKEIPFYAGPFILLCYFLGMFFGALLAQLLIQTGRARLVFLTLALGFVWLVGIFCLTFDEYTHIGTFDEYHSGAARLVFSDAGFMNELNLMGALLFAPAVLLGIFLWRRGKRQGSRGNKAIKATSR